MSEQNIEQNSRHTFIPARQKQRTEKMLLNFVPMWILEGSHQPDLAAEKRKIDKFIEDQYSET